MVIACWSVKGGSGTTVVAAGLALRLARTAAAAGEPPVLLADLAGDVPAVLGRPEPAGPGLLDWLSAGADVAGDALDRLAVDAAPGLRLLATGGADIGPYRATVADGERLADALRAMHHTTSVIDCGSIADDAALAIAASASRSLMIVRPCYLALRRALAAPIRPSAVVLIVEEQRTLAPEDVEDVLGVPVIAVPCDPVIARAVDAGLLASRLPRPLDRALRGAA